MNRLDASFWGYVLVALFSIGSLGCLAVAAAHSRSGSDTPIMTTDNCPPPSDLL